MVQHRHTMEIRWEVCPDWPAEPRPGRILGSFWVRSSYTPLGICMEQFALWAERNGRRRF